jgi:hypothetical protein
MTSSTLPTGSQGFSVSAEDAPAKVFALLGQFQDQIGELVRHANVLGRTLQLGGGYAQEMADFMAKLAIADPGLSTASGQGADSAKDALIAAGQRIDKQRTAIKTALEKYQAADADAGVDCSGG